MTVNWKQQLNKNSLLIDTGVLLRGFKNAKEAARFFSDLKEAGCTPVSFPFVRFEFMKGAKSPEHKKLRDEFWENLGLVTLPSRPSDAELMDLAEKVAYEYAVRDLSGASLVDCVITAFALRHAENLCIATLNLKDFPSFLFDMIHVYPIDEGKCYCSVALLKIDSDKAKSMGLLN